jgi:hypothetical protein
MNAVERRIVTQWAPEMQCVWCVGYLTLAERTQVVNQPHSIPEEVSL